MGKGQKKEQEKWQGRERQKRIAAEKAWNGDDRAERDARSYTSDSIPPSNSKRV